MDRGQRVAVLVSLGLIVVTVIPLVLWVIPAVTDLSKDIVSNSSGLVFRDTHGYTKRSSQYGPAYTLDGALEEPSQAILDSVVIEMQGDSDTSRVWFYVTNRTNRKIDSIRVVVFDADEINAADVEGWTAQWPPSEQWPASVEIEGVWSQSRLERDESIRFVALHIGLSDTVQYQGAILNTP
ncbi:MAG: hypothetical protein SGJ05_08415 [bacterium]|nr:hypothetical protein [bacterium]